MDQNVWHCICQSGWRGLGCDVATETLCSDGKDNEGGMKERSVDVQQTLLLKTSAQRMQTLLRQGFMP